jgi:hypothetical protein
MTYGTYSLITIYVVSYDINRVNTIFFLQHYILGEFVVRQVGAVCVTPNLRFDSRFDLGKQRGAALVQRKIFYFYLW